MKALTLHPEWIFPILELDKDVENRSWAPPRAMVNQDFAIHAGANIGGTTSASNIVDALYDVMHMARAARWQVSGKPWGVMRFQKGGEERRWSGRNIVKSCVVAVAKIVAVFDPGGSVEVHEYRRAKGSSSFPRVQGSSWGVNGQYQWVLGEVRPLVPIPCRGHQRFWEIAPDIEEEVLAQISPRD